MVDFLISEQDDDPEGEEVFDFTIPEDVLIEVVPFACIEAREGRWPGFSIESCTVIRGKTGVTGAASYEQSYGGFLDYVIEDLIECPGEGFFVVEGVTGNYTKGDGWMSDDDMSFDYKLVRPATPEDIALG